MGTYTGFRDASNKSSGSSKMGLISESETQQTTQPSVGISPVNNVVQSTEQPSVGITAQKPMIADVKIIPVSEMVKPVGMYPVVQPKPVETQGAEAIIAVSPYKYNALIDWHKIGNFEYWPEEYRKVLIEVRANPDMTLEEIANKTNLDENVVNYVMEYFVNNDMVNAQSPETVRSYEVTLSGEKKERYGKEYGNISRRKAKRNKDNISGVM